MHVHVHEHVHVHVHEHEHVHVHEHAASLQAVLPKLFTMRLAMLTVKQAEQKPICMSMTQHSLRTKIIEVLI